MSDEEKKEVIYRHLFYKLVSGEWWYVMSDNGKAIDEKHYNYVDGKAIPYIVTRTPLKKHMDVVFSKKDLLMVSENTLTPDYYCKDRQKYDKLPNHVTFNLVNLPLEV
jgi:hypothetical protein